MRKKLLLIAAFLLLAVIISGCETKKTAISAAKFAEKMMAAGLTVNDNTDSTEPEVSSLSYRAVSSDGSIEILFSETVSAETAQSLFSKEKNLKWKDASSKKAVSRGNFSYAVIDCNEGHYLFSAVDGTYLSSFAQKGSAEALDLLVSSLGYYKK